MGRLGRNLLYYDLNEIAENQMTFDVTNAKDVFEHKRMPLHYKLVTFFYLKKWMIGVKMLRWLVRFKRRSNV